jgi:hypothetical protein
MKAKYASVDALREGGSRATVLERSGNTEQKEEPIVTFVRNTRVQNLMSTLQQRLGREHKLPTRNWNSTGKKWCKLVTGLFVWTGWVGKGVYLPLILSLASAVGFCLSRACCTIFLSSIGEIYLYCYTTMAFEKRPRAPQHKCVLWHF